MVRGNPTVENAMSFRVSGLKLAPFQPLFALGDAALLARGAQRCVADEKPGFPCRVSLEDAVPGERLILLNFEHQPALSPYRASGPIFVREAARQAMPEIGEVPESLRLRLLSVRAYDAADLIAEAEIVEGRDLEPLIARFLDDGNVAYLHLHYARRGCYAARIDRA
jgi:hypothetical protein